ncbi:SanA/YdcF family protein [Reichenbachiella ulvae]|uniref:YdcF family protein n=1 Tax=Reichenbachiella ulvae TaxID=2980104 RepID=A0ABT3CTQ0_9BACT|nr:ElyC/SanA/YdcF family protein [Reichenbachiella ulvae]MCV9387048.1 YdcF family protein [Reichenbachiella ulvae]
MTKRKALIPLLLLSPFLLLILSNLWIERQAENKTFSDPAQIQENRVGLVLGTSKYVNSGRINLYFQYRINAAVALYEAGKVNFILISGDNGSKRYDEPTDFKNELIERGIPEEKIYLDYAGFRTLDSVVRAKEIFGQSSITVISQKFHNERAIFLAEQNGLSAVGFNARDVSSSYGLKTHLREYLARTRAVLDICLGVEPKFLGDKIEIK